MMSEFEEVWLPGNHIYHNVVLLCHHAYKKLASDVCVMMVCIKTANSDPELSRIPFK